MEHHLTFDWHILFYFFLSGTSGGAFILATSLTLFAPQHQKTKKLALYEAYGSVIFLAIGATLLFHDLGQPLRVWRLMAIPILNPASPIAWGSVIIGAQFIMLAIYIYAKLANKASLSRVASYVGLFTATLITIYTGHLLSICLKYPLWNSAMMVPLFFLSSCISGLSALFLINFAFRIISPNDDIFIPLRKVFLYFVIADGMILTDYYILHMFLVQKVEAAQIIVAGQLAPLFWGGEVILGIMLPVFILLSRHSKTVRGMALASALAFTGVFIMRYIIIIGGQM